MNIRRIVLVIMIICSCQTKAQQIISITKVTSLTTKSIKLPIAVLCKFKNGTKQNLVLEAIKNDSLFFRKYYNNSQIFDCSINEIKTISLTYKLPKLTYTTFALAAGVTGTILGLTIYGLNTNNETFENASFGLALFPGIPLSIISIIGTSIYGNKTFNRTYYVPQQKSN